MQLDISLLNTFLEVCKTRHFAKAAKALFITQSAVSARIKLLEDQLSIKLLTRDRNNIQLTPAGVRFQVHAENIVIMWNRARQETALDDQNKILLSIGGVFSLWEALIQKQISKTLKNSPDIVFRMEAHSQEMLLHRVLDGSLDLGIMFESPQMHNLNVREVGNFELVLVSTHQGLSAEEAITKDDYVLIDWGTEFSTIHARTYQAASPPMLRANLGGIGLSYLLNNGGSAYLEHGAVASFIESEQLFPIEDAMIINRKIYAVYSTLCTRMKEVESFLENFS